MQKLYDGLRFLVSLVWSAIRGVFWSIKNDPAKRRVAAVLLMLALLSLVLWIGNKPDRGRAWQHVRPYQFYR